MKNRFNPSATVVVVANVLLSGCVATWSDIEWQDIDWPESGTKEREPIDAVERQQLQTILQIARTSAEAGDYPVAQRIYYTAAEEFPDELEPKLGLAALATQQGDHLSAQRFLEDAAQIKGLTTAEQAQIAMNLGRVHLRQEQYGAAREQFDIAVASGQGLTLGYAHNGLAYLHNKVGARDLARTHFEHAIQASGRYPLFVMNLIRALVEWDAPDEARALYAQYPVTYWSEAEHRTLEALLDG